MTQPEGFHVKHPRHRKAPAAARRRRRPIFITFDPPGSIGTAPFSINAPGAITGKYMTAPAGYGAIHGFLRAKNGGFTTFDGNAFYKIFH